MNAPARMKLPTKAEIARAIDAARACGIDVAGFEVSRDGSIRVYEARSLPRRGNTFDQFADQL
jgi:hypothetical protein